MPNPRRHLPSSLTLLASTPIAKARLSGKETRKEVTPQASFTNDLGADSLDTVEIIMDFEKEFNIAIPDEQAEKINTVGEAIAYIEANVK